jgi:CTP:molybdopterin cytidylyltransferase MocA
MALEGDRGGRGIRQAHDACVVTLEAPNEELRDIDTLTDLEQLKN